MSIKYMDIAEFITEGYLQEANRQFFHPLGLALVVSIDDENPNAEWKLHGVWDNREDPEGIAFANGVLSESKADHIKALLDARAAHREKSLGYVIQGFMPSEE